jgi:hypothetical protein
LITERGPAVRPGTPRGGGMQIARTRPPWRANTTSDAEANAALSRGPNAARRLRLRSRALDHGSERMRQGRDEWRSSRHVRPSASMLRTGPSPCRSRSGTGRTEKPRRPALLRIDGAGTEKRPDINEADASAGGEGSCGPSAADAYTISPPRPKSRVRREIFFDPKTAGQGGRIVRSMYPRSTDVTETDLLCRP